MTCNRRSAPVDQAAAVQQLLDELCVDLGLCLPPDQQHRLRRSPPLDVEAFTDAVRTAEGVDPHLDKALRRRVHERVGQQMPALVRATNIGRVDS